MSKVYEVIWSVCDDRYIVREALPYSRITPEFIGTLEACNAYLLRCYPR